MRYQGALLAIIVLGAVFLGHSVSNPTNNTIAQENVNALALSEEPIANIQNETASAKTNSGKILVNKPELNTESYLAKYLGDDSFSLEWQSYIKWPMASLTKLMTAVIVRENMYDDQNATMTKDAISSEGVVGNFKLGEIFKVKDLLEATLGVSSNDAAVALADAYPGGESKFIKAMNDKAQLLEMKNTNFSDPTGLLPLNQSTAEDLYKLVNYVYREHPEIFAITRQSGFDVLELKSRKKRHLININRFAGQPDFIGGKTGYIEESSQNLITLLSRNNKVLVSIVLGSDDRYKETDSLIGFFEKQ